MSYRASYRSWLDHILLNSPVRPGCSISPAGHRSAPCQGVAGKRLFSSGDLDGWETVIGLEIHTQLKTKRKLFSRSRTSWEDTSNEHVLPFDAAFPGTLPVLNRRAVHLALRTALALKCDINPRSTFDRKHYFYHDIPASFQITQHYNPIAINGIIGLSARETGVERDFEVGIEQIQLEQDTAKTSRQGDVVQVDLNRAGMGLMEIVTRPDMRSPEEAGAFIRKLQSLLRRLGASDGDMEKGSLRVDANVSVHRKGEAWGMRCEIKNLNSVRFMQQALDFERKRHLKHYLANPGVPIRQETRGFNEAAGETFTLRTKEDAEDYRYMPDPNIPPIVIDPAYLTTLAEGLPELSDALHERLPREYGISAVDVDTLIGMDDVDGLGVQYFEDVVKLSGLKDGKKVVNWITNELLGQLSLRAEPWSPSLLPPPILASLVHSIESSSITGTSGKKLLQHLLSSQPLSPDLSLPSLIDSLGLRAQSAGDLEELCQAAVEALPKEAEAVRKGNEKVVMRLVGWVMKGSGGTADAKKAREILLSLLSK